MRFGNKALNGNCQTILPILFLIFCECFFFRNIINNDMLIGDIGDSRVSMLIAEHWFHVLHDNHPVTDLGIFYPAEGTLGYADMFFIHGLIHSFFRVLRLDIFCSFKAAVILMHTIGTFSCFYLIKKICKTDSWWALFGTMTFSFSTTYAVRLCHTQLVAISLIPLLFILMINFLKNINYRNARNCYAVSAIILIASLLYTSWYIFFFTCLFCTVVAAVAVTIYFVDKKINFTKIVGLYNLLIKDMICYTIIFTLFAFPFIYIELPLLKISGGHSYKEIWPYIPEIIDTINTSQQNLLTGNLVAKLNLYSRGYSGEVEAGFSIVLLLLFTLSFYVFVKSNKQIIQHDNSKSNFIKIVLISVVVSILLTIQFTSNHISLWYLVYKFFPGGMSVRAVCRFFIFLSLPMSIITSVTCNYLFKTYFTKKNSYVIVMIYVITLSFAFNINIPGVASAWSRDDSLNYINNIKTPPNYCNSFYIVYNTYDNDIVNIIKQVDSYQIADHFNLKTLNGYSPVKPAGYADLSKTKSKDDYMNNIDNWIKSHNLTNVCIYDDRDNSWNLHR